MINIKLSEIRNPSILNHQKEVLQIVDGRKNQSMGYFIPKHLMSEFKAFFDQIEKKKKHQLLTKVAAAQKEQTIE